MGHITVKFINKEYSIPQDVLTYIDLLSFTDNIQKQLFGSFLRKLNKEIAKDSTGLLDDEDLAAEMEQQISKFITKLCDNGIFTRTINDYLKNNKGYQLYSEVNRAALEKIKSLLLREVDALRTGYESAVNKAESNITGMGFSIWSSSFLHHAIYAAMEASTINKQEKQAQAQYQKDISELHFRLTAQYGSEKSNYINNTYIPNMDAALTVFTYELLDKYIADLIANGKFDKAALAFVDIGRSNDLLKNLALSNNKNAILENAFVACPYNIAVYMQAMKMEMLDEDTFETANIFKQGSQIISFLNESLGVADYPNFVEPNYYSAMLLARYTNKSVNDVLHQHTSSYANAVIREYGNIVKALNNSTQCRNYLRKLSDDEILSGESSSKQLADSLVHSIALDNAWKVLVEQCGHSDMFERLLAVMPVDISFNSKADCDSYLAKALFNALEVIRKELSEQIKTSRARAEEARQKAEKEKQKKTIKNTVIVVAIILLIILVASLPTIIENSKNNKREAYIESQIQEVVDALEQKIENQIDDDITITFSYTEFMGYEHSLKWSFSIRMAKFDEFVKSGGEDEQLLLEIMDNCRIIDDVVETENDTFDFDFNYNDINIGISNYDGAVKYINAYSSETFYYEEYGEKRYLHSRDTEYVLDKNVAYQIPEMFLDYQLGDPIFSTQVSEQTITINEVNGHLYAKSTDTTTITSLYWISSNSNGNKQEIVDTAHERIISYFENLYGRGEQVKVPSGFFPHYWGFDDETVTQFITKSGLVYLVGPNSEYNIYVVQIENPF